MQHKLELTAPEKLKSCFDLTEVVFQLMKNTLGQTEFEKKLKRLRKKHLEKNMELLKKLGGLPK